jgi:Undecaprenyl-phosphate galactose phosphotransferase WbaP
MSLTEYESWYKTRYRRTSSSLTATALIISDILAVLIAFGIGFFLVNLYDIHVINFKSFVTYSPYLPIFIVIFYFMHLYPGISLAPAEELRRFSIGTLIVYGGIILSRYIEHRSYDAVSIAFILSFIFSPILLLVFRGFMRYLLGVTKLGGIPAVIFGSGATSRILMDRLLDKNKTGYIPVLILDDDPGNGEEYRGVPIIHDTSLGPEIVKEFHIKMAIIDMPELSSKRLAHILNRSASAFRYNVLVPEFFGVTNIWATIRDFDGILGFATSHKLKMGWNMVLKRCMDLAIVILGGIVISPALILIALLVKLTSSGPVLYGQMRIGTNSSRFKAYKFRSMVVDADERLKKLLESNPEARKEWESNHKLKNDPRITGIGKFLRKTSLDEFPQLINILKGEMSLVGPRPIVDDEIKKYGEDFSRIFSVKPGLSGLWQVSGRSDTDYASRVAFDTYYLQNWSVWLDLWVLYKTVGVVFRGRGAY